MSDLSPEMAKQLGTATREAVEAHIAPLEAKLNRLEKQLASVSDALEKAVDQGEHNTQVIDDMLSKLS